MAEFPAVTVRSAGDGGVCEREKSAKKIARDTVADWPLLVPLTAKSKGFAVLADNPLTVTVLVSPGVMETGLKLHVPVVHERSMEPWNELGAEAVTVNVVDFVPIRRTLDRTLAESEKTALPVPDRETV